MTTRPPASRATGLETLSGDPRPTLRRCRATTRSPFQSPEIATRAQAILRHARPGKQHLARFERVDVRRPERRGDLRLRGVAQAQPVEMDAPEAGDRAEDPRAAEAAVWLVAAAASAWSPKLAA